MFCLICMCILAGCTDSNNEIIKEIDSPDSKYTAFYFCRDLGATTQKSYQLSIFKEGTELGDKGGNIFVTYGEFDIKWESENVLVVSIKEDDEKFKQLEEYKDVEIRYSDENLE